MNQDLLKTWLRKKKTAGHALNLLGCVAGLVAGLVVLFLTFWFTYAVIWFGWYGVNAVSELAFSKSLHLSHGMRLAGSGIFVALLFLQHFRTNPEHWGDYPDREYNTKPGSAVIGGGVGSMVILLAYPGASANMIADILLSGPRLMTGSFKLAALGRGWKRVDENGCAELLNFLSARIDAMPYEELRAAGWEPYMEQLRYIDGVQFLEKGLMLTTDLKTELNGLN